MCQKCGEKKCVCGERDVHLTEKDNRELLKAMQKEQEVADKFRKGQ